MERRVLPLVAVLVVLGILGVFLRSFSLGYPLFPRMTERIWGARLVVRWEPRQAPVTVLLPLETARQRVEEERVQAAGLETSIRIGDDGLRQLQWRGRDARSAIYEAELVLQSTGARQEVQQSEVERWRRTEAWQRDVGEKAR